MKLQTELNNLRFVLMKTISNKNNSEKNRLLAQEALNVLNETIRDLSNPRSKEEATTRIDKMLRAGQQPQYIEGKV